MAKRYPPFELYKVVTSVLSLLCDENQLNPGLNLEAKANLAGPGLEPSSSDSKFRRARSDASMLAATTALSSR